MTDRPSLLPPPIPAPTLAVILATFFTHISFSPVSLFLYLSNDLLSRDALSMTSKLLHTSPLEAATRTELFLRESYAFLHHSLKPPFPLSIPSPSEYTRLISALAYAILTQPHLAKTHFTHLVAVVTDGYNLFTTTLTNLVNEAYPKLLGPSRIQLIWVSSKLVDVSAVGVENLLVSLLRQINGGDLSDANLWLSAELVKVFTEKWDWVSSEPSILTSALFTYLRLMSDHCRVSGVEIDKLKRLEIDFCTRVLRECFELCLKIGRDLLRLVQDLVHIPEFGELWNDLLCNPSAFRVPGFSDIKQIYNSRTSSRYFLLRIRPDMETQLRFLLTHVKWGSQKRYQVWFAKKFLCVPEREAIIPDIIRFICCCHHPPNQIIQSNVISRWAVIGWLLKCCRKSQFEANSKLALFYDWLFFDEKVDNVMNIEPAILLMVHSIPQYVYMTETLLEFLFLLVDGYDVIKRDMIAGGVSNSFSVILKKGVVQSFEAMTSCESLSPRLKEKLLTFLLNPEPGVGKVAPTYLPLQPIPSTLPSLSKVASGASECRALGLPVSCERNGLHHNASDAAVKNSSLQNSQPLNLPGPSDVESRSQHFRQLGPSECSEKNEFPHKLVDAAVRKAVKDSISHLRGNAPSLNLPSPTNVEMVPACLMELEPTMRNESSELHTKASGAAIQEPAQNRLDCSSEQTVLSNQSSSSNVESRPLHFGKSRHSVRHDRIGIYGKAVDASIQETVKDASIFLPANAAPSDLHSPSDAVSRSLQFKNLESSTCHGSSKLTAAPLHESAYLPVNAVQLDLTSLSDADRKSSQLRDIGPSMRSTEAVNATVQDTIQDASAYQLENPTRSNLQSSSEQDKNTAVEVATIDASARVPENFATMGLMSEFNSESRPTQFKDGDKMSELHSNSILDNTISNVNVAKTNENVIAILENPIQELKTALKESMQKGLSTLEKILFSYAAIDSRESGTEKHGSSVFRSDALACHITDIFKLSGCELFICFDGRSTWLDYDDDFQSVTAVVIRVFIFSPNERMNDLLLSWTRKGHAVGPCLLSYVSRLAYEAKSIAGLMNPTNAKKLSHEVHDGDLSNGDARRQNREHNNNELTDSTKSLLKCHIDGYISFLGSIGKDPPNPFLPSKTHPKFICNLVGNAFIAYRGFLKFLGMKVSLASVYGNNQVGGNSSSISCNGLKDIGPIQSTLLMSDLKHCCQWKAKKQKLIFCSVFSHLSDLSTGREDFIRLLVDVLDHVDLISIQFEVGLKRFSIFSEDPRAITDLVKSTFYWDSSEQQKFWGLLISELVVSKLHVEKMVSDLCLGLLYIGENSVAVEGLLKLLRSCYPSQELIATILSLPNNFGDFATAVLASWAASRTSTFFDNLAGLLQNIKNADGGSKSSLPVDFSVNHHVIVGLLSFLDNGLMRSSDNFNELDCCISKVKEHLYYMIAVHGHGLS
ncbi:hypothetical protein ACLOJK_031497 [Asimina triloba]